MKEKNRRNRSETKTVDKFQKQSIVDELSPSHQQHIDTRSQNDSMSSHAVNMQPKGIPFSSPLTHFKISVTLSHLIE